MIIISHRGNTDGPEVESENHPDFIDKAISTGFEVEVDLRFIDGDFWLGHDEPQWRISEEWMSSRRNKIWFHCKDFESATALINTKNGYKFFCHSNEPYVCTSHNYLWVHDLSYEIDKNCIIPLISDKDLTNHPLYKNCHGICTDYPSKIVNEYR
jgi:hypothetical protein